MTVVDGGDLVAQSLAQHGVTHLFGLGGGHINPTWWAEPITGLKVFLGSNLTREQLPKPIPTLFFGRMYRFSRAMA